MAKGKHAAALFEVIHADKRFDSRAMGTSAGSGGRARRLLRTPKWWFKGRPHDSDSTADDGAAGKHRSAPVSAAPSPIEPPGSSQASAFGAPGAGGIHVSVDPDGQHVTLRLSYTAAAVVAFTIGVTVVLAYLAGKQMRSSASAGPLISTLTTEQLRGQPPRPSVLDVPSRGAGSTYDDGNAPAIGGASASPPGGAGNRNDDDDEPAGDDGTVASPSNVGGQSTRAGSAAPQWFEPAPPSTLVVDGAARTIGLNYVVVQSYADEKLAAEAAGVLKNNGIDCTVERGLKGWPAAWHIVVGTRGFDRISSPEFKDYIRKIQAVSKIFAPKGGYKAFQPTAKKWDREK